MKRRYVLILLFCIVPLTVSAWFMTGEERDQLSVDAGIEAIRSGNYAEAFNQLIPLAKEGNPEAQYNMGWLYANGFGAGVDVPTAVYWWKKAAASNHAASQFSLGMVYLTGDGKTIKKNVPEAIHWHMRSARNGYVEGQEMIRQLYETRKRAVLKLYPDIATEPWFSKKKSAE
ncbi:MAG: tetratricopeptide repeat protein [Chromatiales bacterium]|jgi:TPR repeat protein